MTRSNVTPIDRHRDPAVRTEGLDRPGRDALVGRERERQELASVVEETLGGRARLVLLAGEPGIGKTRLAQEVAASAEERGFEVLAGRCYEDEGVPAYWPWVQVLRAHVARRNAATLAAEVGPAAADIAQLVPDLRDRFPDLPAPPSQLAAHARFRLFDGITTFLMNLARRQPLLLVLEDLHWADTPSLVLLQYVSREMGSAPLLVLGTYRDVEVGPEHPLFRTLAELVREPATRRLVLHGLRRADVARYIEATAGVVPSPAVVAHIADQTEGNPFFAGEIVRLLIAEEGVERLQAAVASSHRVPQGVREVIGRRLGRLSTRCHELLRIGSVIGQEFGLNVLEKTSGLPHDSLLEALEEATRARLVLEVPGALGRYRLAHALVRQTLYHALPIPHRVRLHRQVGEALERAYAADLEPHLAELAHHFAQAAVAGEARKAVDYARRAAERAAAQNAHEVAVTHDEQALQALALMETMEPTEHCDLLLALARHQAGAGEIVGSRATLFRAAPFARQCDGAVRLARCAIGLWNAGSGWTEPGRLDEAAVALLEEALARLGSEDSELRARALGVLVRILCLSDMPASVAKAVALGREAVAMARRIGNPEVLVDCLFSQWFALRGPDHLESRREITTEWVGVAKFGPLADGYICRIQDSLESGDRAAVDRDIESLCGLPMDVLCWFPSAALDHRALLAQMTGRFEELERLNEDARAAGRRAGGGLASRKYAARRLVLRREQGRGRELEAAMRRSLARHPADPSTRAALALICAESGLAEDARRELAILAATGFDDMPREGSFFFDAASLSEACARLGERGLAATLLERLRPYSDRFVQSGGIVCLGSVAHYLGLLAATLGRFDDAARYFEQALEANARMGLVPYLAHTQHEYARMLLSRGEPGDRSKALALLRNALDTARELGMTALLERAQTLEIDAPETIGSADAEIRISPAAAHFRREGDYWTVAYEGSVCRLRDTTGLRYLAHLLHHPGRDIHVLELMRAVTGCPVDADSRSAHGAAGPVLDARAKAAYRSRLADLRDALAEAEAFHDLGRADRAREEIERLTEQLAAAVGLGGRDREVGSNAERARSAITHGIKGALRRITEREPSLGRALAPCIRTGTFCAYTPDPARPLQWEL